MSFYSLFEDLIMKHKLADNIYIQYFKRIYLNHNKKKRYLRYYHFLYVLTKYLTYCGIVLISLIVFLIIFGISDDRSKESYYELISVINTILLSVHGIIFDIIGSILNFNKKHYVNNQILIGLEIIFTKFIKEDLDSPTNQKKLYSRINKLIQNYALKENINIDVELLKSDIDTTNRIILKNNLYNNNIVQNQIVKYL